MDLEKKGEVMTTRSILRLSFALVLGLIASIPLHSAGSNEETKASAWDQVVEMYEKAKAAGEQVPKDVYEWAKQDLAKIGNWQYRVVDLTPTDARSVEDRLNELGADQWECIWIQASGNTVRFVFKRPAKSYLKHIPLSQLMKLVPRGGTEGQGE